MIVLLRSSHVPNPPVSRLLQDRLSGRSQVVNLFIWKAYLSSMYVIPNQNNQRNMLPEGNICRFAYPVL